MLTLRQSIFRNVTARKLSNFGEHCMLEGHVCLLHLLLITYLSSTQTTLPIVVLERVLKTRRDSQNEKSGHTEF